MQPNLKMYLLDISNSIEPIYEYLGKNPDFDKYENNKILRRAVEREIEIIGEAINRILKINPKIDMID